MNKIVSVTTIVAGTILSIVSLIDQDWTSLAMVAVVAIGIVAYQRGWIRRLGR